MTHLQTIHTNLLVYVVNLFAFDGSNKIYDFCKGDRYAWATFLTILDTNLSKISGFYSIIIISNYNDL